MDAKKTWEITERMIQGQFTADAVGRSDADYLKATNKARIDACIKEDLEDKLYDANEQLGVIYDIRYSGSGRYTVEYSARGFGRGKNDYQVRQSVVHAPAPIVKDAKAADASTEVVFYIDGGKTECRAKVVSSIPTSGYSRVGSVDGYSVYEKKGGHFDPKGFVAVKMSKDAKGKLVGSGTGGFNLIEPSASEYASFMQSTTAWKKKRRDHLWEKEENGTLTPAEKTELRKLEQELKNAKDASPIKTGGTVQRELEERQMAGWAKRSGGKEPGWYVYQDGQSYAGPYESKAKGEEGLRLANKLHPGHKYEIRVVGTKDAAPYGTMTRTELSKAEKRLDVLYDKEQRGKITTAESNELKTLERAVNMHYAKANRQMQGSNYEGLANYANADSAVKDAIPADILKSAEFKAMVKLKKDLRKQSEFLRKSDDTPDGKLKLPNGEIITKFEYSVRMRKILDQVNEMARKLQSKGVDFRDFVKYVDG